MDSYLPHREIGSLAEWDAAMAVADNLHGWTIQSIDLSSRRDQLAQLDPQGALFLGCTMPEYVENDLRDRGALVFPTLPHVPFNPYRASLYGPGELYDAVRGGGQYACCYDARVYAWTRSLGLLPELPDTLAMALHDHAITAALDEVCAGLDPHHTVGVMGGHSMLRSSDDYIGAARLASSLTISGRTIVTGGGPGAMEAANLGAYLAGQYAALTSAIQELAAVPDFRPNATAWAQVALSIVASTHPSGRSIGVPTWFYGDEPSNVFASTVAKYFSNALREDTLLQRCRGGLVYLPGAAGTVQEIFQAVTGNYYATDESLVTPLVLIGHDYWTRKLAAWPLLRNLGKGRPMESHLHLVDDVDEAATLLGA